MNFKKFAPFLLGGILCLFTKTQTVHTDCPREANLGPNAICGEYRWGAGIFISEIDNNLAECGFTSISPWTMKGNTVIKLIHSPGGNFGVGITDKYVLVDKI